MTGCSIMIVIAGVLLAAALPAGARPWTNTVGRTFEAEFVRMDGANVIFTMPNGCAFSTPQAEYLAITPYKWGYYQTDIYGNSVKTHVTAAWPVRACRSASGDEITPRRT